MRSFCLLLTATIIFALPACASTGPSLFGPPRPPLTPELRAALRAAGAPEHLSIDGFYLRQMDEQLRAVGARMGSDGKMYDRNGKEIYLWSDPGIGVHATPEVLQSMAEAKQRQLAELRSRYTVIVLEWLGPRAC